MLKILFMKSRRQARQRTFRRPGTLDGFDAVVFRVRPCLQWFFPNFVASGFRVLRAIPRNEPKMPVVVTKTMTPRITLLRTLIAEHDSAGAAFSIPILPLQHA